MVYSGGLSYLGLVVLDPKPRVLGVAVRTLKQLEKRLQRRPQIAYGAGLETECLAAAMRGEGNACTHVSACDVMLGEIDDLHRHPA